MTIRQIAEAAGCHINTVRPVARNMFPLVKSSGRGMAIDYDKNQSIKIMERLPKRNMVDPIQKSIPTPTNLEGSSLTQKDLEMIGVIVGHVMKSMESRVSNIESRFEERQALLPPPEMDQRQQLKKIVNSYCGRTRSDFRAAWNDLYREFNYIYHVNVQLSAKNRDMKGVDYVETVLEKLPELISVASKLFADGQLL